MPYFPPETIALLRRATAARRAIKRGADPYLMLSLVIWPTPKVTKADDEMKDAA